ncbi:DUF2169 family type VI secretion system accessory protein [Corallococcus llansteffanensis]|uniref:DUF2169 domain-containing protein n=1 Tax=Corallococcus llansteffanensis TaxID=2316731 RepID=A0A3A8PQJ1_9BACT|nr:DUF2169 domain-containing protein [Corallococcus llansteffanensis]RKH55955.1 DUF2169 domain-containing protein [Corallococcus llansteffanensis]
MLQLRNQTPFVPAMFLFPDERGVDTLYVALKGAFELRGGALFVAEKQQPLVMADEYVGEPGSSGLKKAGEAHLLKPGTDVLVSGEVHAPKGRPVDSCLASVRVGPVRQVLQVFGDRKWKGGLVAPRISSPEPFTRMPLMWERAFGGTHEVGEGHVLAEARNPVGQGFRGKRSGSEMVGRALPNLEDPQHLMSSISDAPAPVGLGPVAPAWEPRRRFAGTYDEAWQTRRAPYLPQDFRPEFFCTAPPALRVREGLKGGEVVECLHLSPEGGHRFTLPRCELAVTVRIAGKPEPVIMRLETVLLEPGAGRLSLGWRGAIGCDKRALKIEEARFEVQSLEGVED